MRGTAALRYPVRRSNRVGLWTGALATAALSSVIAWRLAVPDAGLWQVVTLFVAAMVATIFALWQWWSTQAGYLHFDGRSWSFEREFMPSLGRKFSAGSVAFLVLDWQQIVLVRLKEEVQWHPRWIWLERRVEPATWHALRCALNQGSQRRKAAHAPVPNAMLAAKTSVSQGEQA